MTKQYSTDDIIHGAGFSREFRHLSRDEFYQIKWIPYSEYERLKKKLESAWVTINDLDVRLERACEQHQTLYNEGVCDGVKVGERRAMERVKETILSLDKQFSKGAFQPTLRSLYRELGLGEEEKR